MDNRVGLDPKVDRETAILNNRVDAELIRKIKDGSVFKNRKEMKIDLNEIRIESKRSPGKIPQSFSIPIHSNNGSFKRNNDNFSVDQMSPSAYSNQINNSSSRSLIIDTNDNNNNKNNEANNKNDSIRKPIYCQKKSRKANDSISSKKSSMKEKNEQQTSNFLIFLFYLYSYSFVFIPLSLSFNQYY
jgi:hypothetical protein